MCVKPLGTLPPCPISNASPKSSLNRTRNLQMNGLGRNRASLLLQQTMNRQLPDQPVSIICTAGRRLVFSYMLMSKGSAYHDSHHSTPCRCHVMPCCRQPSTADQRHGVSSLCGGF